MSTELLADVSSSLRQNSNSIEPVTSPRYIPTIEHYVNSYDIVPRWGVLYHVRRKGEDAYSGIVFVHEKAPGHLFDQHYLDSMFPQHYDEDDARAFLNHVVTDNNETGFAKARTWHDPRNTAQASLALIPQSRSVEISDSLDDHAVWAQEARAAAMDSPQRRRVRDLSRLWMHLDGGQP